MTNTKTKTIKWQASGSIGYGGHVDGRAEGLRAPIAIHNLTSYQKQVNGKRPPSMGIYCGGTLVETVQADEYEAAYVGAKARAEALVPEWIAAQASEDERRADEARREREERERKEAQRAADIETIRAMVASGRLTASEVDAIQRMFGK